MSCWQKDFYRGENVEKLSQNAEKPGEKLWFNMVAILLICMQICMRCAPECVASLVQYNANK